MFKSVSMKSKIYSGSVMHARKSPVQHRWTFPFYFYAIDLDELPELDRTVKGFGYNHWKPVSLQDKDYLKNSGSFRERLGEHVDLSGVERIVLITVARFMAKVFNPVSFYYCLDAADRPVCMVAEVNNTFKERHLYMMKADGSFPVHCSDTKQFHVSPFNTMDGHYEFSFSEPGDQLNIEIKLIRENQQIMTAAMWGTGNELTTSNLWKTVLRHPFTAALTMPRIIWQAALLYYKKKLPVFRKPAPSSPNTIIQAGRTTSAPS
jgi:cyclopropane-fatty-acyl-phospholipid synthase